MTSCLQRKYYKSNKYGMNLILQILLNSFRPRIIILLQSFFAKTHKPMATDLQLQKYFSCKFPLTISTTIILFIGIAHSSPLILCFTSNYDNVNNIQRRPLFHGSDLTTTTTAGKSDVQCLLFIGIRTD